MDVRMPDVGGIEAIMRIRSEFPGARIIVLASYAGDAQALGALNAGATLVLAIILLGAALGMHMAGVMPG
jgi:DNA-binding NarL/FixJ family response regulator